MQSDYEDFYSWTDPSSVKVKNWTLKLGYASINHASSAPQVLEDFCVDFFKSSLFANNLIDSMNCAPTGGYYMTVNDASCTSNNECSKTPLLWIHSPRGVQLVRQDIQGFDYSATKFITSTFWVI
jgi:hypothetical protein